MKFLGFVSYFVRIGYYLYICLRDGFWVKGFVEVGGGNWLELFFLGSEYRG